MPTPKTVAWGWYDAAGAPVLVHIHGGYWRALDKSDFSFVAAPFLAQGIAVAVVNYDLCPDVSVATIVGLPTSSTARSGTSTM